MRHAHADEIINWLMDMDVRLPIPAEELLHDFLGCKYVSMSNFALLKSEAYAGKTIQLLFRGEWRDLAKGVNIAFTEPQENYRVKPICADKYCHLKQALLSNEELEWFDGTTWVKKETDTTWTFTGSPSNYRVVK